MWFLKLMVVIVLVLIAVWLFKRAKKLGYFERKEFASYKGTKYWTEPDKAWLQKNRYRIGIPVALAAAGMSLWWILS